MNLPWRLGEMNEISFLIVLQESLSENLSLAFFHRALCCFTHPPPTPHVEIKRRTTALPEQFDTISTKTTLSFLCVPLQNWSECRLSWICYPQDKWVWNCGFCSLNQTSWCPCRAALTRRAECMSVSVMVVSFHFIFFVCLLDELLSFSCLFFLNSCLDFYENGKITIFPLAEKHS